MCLYTRMKNPVNIVNLPLYPYRFFLYQNYVTQRDPLQREDVGQFWLHWPLYGAFAGHHSLWWQVLVCRNLRGVWTRWLNCHLQMIDFGHTFLPRHFFTWLSSVSYQLQCCLKTRWKEIACLPIEREKGKTDGYNDNNK